MKDKDIVGHEDDALLEEMEEEGIAMELLHEFKENNRRMDEHNKRLISALKFAVVSFAVAIILVVIIFFGGHLLFLNQYEFENYSQDGSGYNNINTGTQGDVNNGTEIPSNEKKEWEGEGDS